MKLTTRSRYGTRLVVDIATAAQDHPVRLADVAKRQKISVKYLEKLIRVLKKAGFITSRRGPKGGHMLKRPANEITIGQLVRVLEGNHTLVECDRGGRTCPRIAICQTQLVWREAEEAMYERLDSVTVADLISEDGFCSNPPPDEA